MVHLFSDELRWHGRKVEGGETPEYTLRSPHRNEKQETKQSFQYTLKQFHF